MIDIEVWDSCYDDGWRGYIVPEAFAHPAKAARGLLSRIFKQLEIDGDLPQGAIVVDPFGGVGTTGIIGAARGALVVCCELEEKFVSLAAQNFSMHAKVLNAARRPLPVIVQGDSRRLREHVGPVLAACVVSSPPYNLVSSQTHNGRSGGTRMLIPSEPGAFARYGNTAGQLEGLPPGDIDAVVSSPPYAGVDAVVSSPPYANAVVSECNPEQDQKRLQAKAARGELHGEALRKAIKGINPNSNERMQSYGTTDGQLGAQTTATFWHAAKDIVSECHALLRPGGVAVWIVKAYVKDKKLVDFPGDWRKLCESVGFVTEREVHASLVQETRADTLFDGERITRTERKSFFRRLAEKRGSPRIDHEVVYFMRKES